MRNTYNKGNFRNGEWAKHLRAEGKKLGNRKWRRTAGTEIDEQIEQNETLLKNKSLFRKKKTILAKYNIVFFNTKWTRVKKYANLRDARNVMNRPNVSNFKILDTPDS